jgi:pseudouridine-5'-phosphate glycosidase
VHPAVASALKASTPVVALESTIISHGMPYPRNLQVAREIEELIRQHGCVPATCAVIEGVCKVGLSADELEFLAQGSKHGITKASRRVSVRERDKYLHTYPLTSLQCFLSFSPFGRT